MGSFADILLSLHLLINIKLVGLADTPEGCDAIQQDLESLESWVRGT